MAMTGIEWWDYLKWVSAHHLTEEFPDEVLQDSKTNEHEMHEARLKWIEDHVCERNEYRDREDIFDDMHILAVSVCQLVKEKINAQVT
jgi:hypothetical protein